MDRVVHDVRQAIRALFGDRAIAVVIVVTLALAIGANATVFSLVDSLLFRPLPRIAHPENVVAIYTAQDGMLSVSVSSFADYRDFRERSTSFDELAAYKPLDMDLSGGEVTIRLEGMLVTASYFDALGVRPILGRFFEPPSRELFRLRSSRLTAESIPRTLPAHSGASRDARSAISFAACASRPPFTPSPRPTARLRRSPFRAGSTIKATWGAFSKRASAAPPPRFGDDRFSKSRPLRAFGTARGAGCLRGSG